MGWALKEVKLEKMIVKCSFANLGLSGSQSDVILNAVMEKYCYQLSRAVHENKNHRQSKWATGMQLLTEPEIDC